MASRRTGLHPDVLLDIELSVVLSHNKFTDDAGPVVEELRKVAGDRIDVLAASVGRWVGFYEKDHPALCAGLRDHPDLTEGIALGRKRRNIRPMTTAGFHHTYPSRRP